MPVMRKGGKRLRVSGKTARSSDCCCDCLCPFATFGDAPTFTVSFHAKVYSDGADRTTVLCDDDYEITLYPVGSVDDPFTCSWHSDAGDEFFCDVSIDIGIQLYLDTVTCKWTLGFDTAGPSESVGFTSRPGGASNYLGAYPDIDNAGSGTVITDIVLS